MKCCREKCIQRTNEIIMSYRLCFSHSFTKEKKQNLNKASSSNVSVASLAQRIVRVSLPMNNTDATKQCDIICRKPALKKFCI